MSLQAKLSEERALADLATDSVAVVKRLRETGRPLVLTTEGREVAVLLSPEAFETLRQAAGNPVLQKAVDAAEQGIADGHWVEHSEVVGKLRRWAAGEP